jgi:hypothetical protein
LAFACAGATPLDTCSILANQTWVNGPVIVTAPGGGTPPGQFRMTTGGGIGSMWYNDGGTTFLLLTNSGDWNGNYNSLRPFYANNATGDVTMAHNVTVGGALTASNYLNSVNGTYVSPASGAQWRMYSDGNSLIWTEAGTLRFWFDHNANTFNVGGTGNLNVGGNLSVAGSISSSVAYNCVGANAAYTLDDRTTTGTSANWVMYANSGYLRFFRGGDKATIDTSGTYRGSGTYTAMSAPDSTSYIYIGGTADPQTYYRNGTHTFQNVAASLTWLTINSSVISCYENIAPNADNARYCGFGGNAWLACNSYAYAQSSDAALKTDIEPVRDGCLDLVRAIEPKTYRFINAPVPDVRTRWGFLANDIEDVMLAAEIEFGGYQEQNGVRALEYNQLTAVLWKAVQELSAEVTALKARIPDV